MTLPFRLILDEPRSAVMNMALDELLAVEQRHEAEPPALRFYRWESPSVSAGYFQPLSAVDRSFQCLKKDQPLVRRMTGGGAVLHGKDLTFSLALKNPNPFFPTDTKMSYLKINEALRAGLIGLFPELDYADCRTAAPLGRAGKERVCFEAPSCYDLLLAGKKVVGASQRRLGRVLLHQSSVFLDLPFEEAARRIRSGFEEKWRVRFEARSFSEEELREAEKLAEARYASEDWALPVFLASSLRS